MSKTTLFGTDGIRSVANEEPLTPETLVRIGAVLGWMAVEFPGSFSYPHGQEIPEDLDVQEIENIKPRVVTVRDPRRSGDMIEAALEAGLTASGADVISCGLLPTPAASVLTREFGANLGISISASHNPPEYNGIKLFTPSGHKISSHLEEKIEKLLNNDHSYPPVPVQGDRIGQVTFKTEEAKQTYINFLLEGVEDVDLSDLDVVVDAGHGAGGAVSDELFDALGCRTTILSGEPDGQRINQAAGTSDLTELRKTVQDLDADLGIALDGDADRVQLIDETGTERDGDAILAALASHMHDHGRLSGNTVVGTVMTNEGLASFLKNRDIDLKRPSVGDRNIAHELFENDWSLGGEQSGHVILYDRSPTGDGLQTALAVLRLMKETGSRASNLLSQYDRFPQILRNVTVSEKPPLEELDQVNKCVNRWEESLQDTGRVLIRYSGTEPVCRVMVEGEDKELIAEAAEDIARAVRETLPE